MNHLSIIRSADRLHSADLAFRDDGDPAAPARGDAADRILIGLFGGGTGMNRLAVMGLLTAELLGTAALGTAAPPVRRGATAGSSKTMIERGAYLVTAGGCNDCHTPKRMGTNGPEPDPTRLLSGHPEQVQVTAPASLGQPWLAATTADLTAWSGPWGVSFAINLTPDQNAGIGIWTEEMFVKAMRTGKHMGTSRPILPPMPWQNLGQLTDTDLKALFAYLKSIPPVTNRVPEPLPPAAAPAAKP
jgi:mono/diheme cytochrome c family protein